MIATTAPVPGTISKVLVEKPRKPVFEPGIHRDVPAKTYHSAEGVSNSDLKVFGGDSPRHYWNKTQGIPEDDSELSDDERESRVMGTLLHLAVLEPDQFARDKSHYIQPATYTNEKGETKKWSGNATVCKQWLADHTDRPILSEKEERRLLGAREAVLNHPVAGALLRSPGVAEGSIFARHPQTGLTLRCRPDWMTTAADGVPWFADLKSCPSVKKFINSMRDFRYDVQSVFYTDVAALADLPAVQFCFIAVELKPRYGIHAVRVVMVEEETQREARAIYEQDLARFSVCQETGNWPLGNESIETVRVKRWVN